MFDSFNIGAIVLGVIALITAVINQITSLKPLGLGRRARIRRDCELVKELPKGSQKRELKDAVEQQGVEYLIYSAARRYSASTRSTVGWLLVTQR